MTTLAKVTHPHIVKEPGYCGGKAALAYHYDHPEEIEAELRADETAAERYEQERAADLARRAAK